MVVGFYVHTDMDFVVTERREDAAQLRTAMSGSFKIEAGALPGAYDE